MNEFQLDGKLLAFDEEKREVEVLLLPWDAEAEQASGIHRFERGAFKDVDPARFRFRQRHMDPPTGRGIALTEEEDGPHLRLRVSKTREGDDQLTLLRDGVEDGISFGFDQSEHREERLKDGRTRYTHTGFANAKQLEASTTWKPAFSTARVLSFNQEEATVAEADATPQAEAQAPADFEQAFQAFQEHVTNRFEALQDRIAQNGLAVPEPLKGAYERKLILGTDLMDPEVRQAFAVDDVISSDNLGVIPEMRSDQIIGIIDSSRPFLENTTREPTPPAGETWKFPKITQRPEVGKQSAEKAELASQKTVITSVDFPMETYGGVGDLSLQLIKRSSPSFLELWTRLLAEQYAIVTDDAALDDLLGTAAVVEGTGTFDPESPSFGEAFQNAATAAGSRPALLPNRIFLSTAALVAFIDAKSPSGGGGTPLYPGLASISGVQSGDGGAGPAGFNMKPVWVPAMDDESVDVIIGPSQGFHWTEDGTYTLTADVPEKAGRDVGLVGMIWFAPIYPAAFTTYALAS